MIERNGVFGSFEIYCDDDDCDCSKEFDTDDDFKEAMKQAREEGWTMHQDDGHWVHYCPEHSEEDNDM